MSVAELLLLILIVAIVAFLFTSVKIAREYERGVVFRLGRLLPDLKGPGLFITIPRVDQVEMVSLQTVTVPVPRHEVITADGVTITMDAVMNYQVIDPRRAVVQVQNFRRSTLELAQTTLRSVVGTLTLDELLSRRDKVNQQLKEIIDRETGQWGVRVTALEIKDFELPQEMQRALAVSAEAERERRAKVIAAQGEQEAAGALAAAAKTIAAEPMALQLRYLQTMVEIVSNDSTSTVIVPLPIDLIEPFLRRNQAPPPVIDGTPPA